MIITAEISYYPLLDNYAAAVKEFLTEINKSGIDVEVGTMSTILTGEFVAVMKVLNEGMSLVLEKYPSVFNVKISNSCRR